MYHKRCNTSLLRGYLLSSLSTLYWKWVGGRGGSLIHRLSFLGGIEAWGCVVSRALDFHCSVHGVNCTKLWHKLCKCTAFDQRTKISTINHVRSE